MMSGEYEYDLMATRRKDPDYEQVSGYVHKDLALKFRIICMTERLTQSEALEQALKLWTEFKNLKDSQQIATPADDDGEESQRDRTPPPTPDNGEASQQSPSPKATKAKRKGNEP